MSGFWSPRLVVFINAIMIVSCQMLLSKARGYNKYSRGLRLLFKGLAVTLRQS